MAADRQVNLPRPSGAGRPEGTLARDAVQEDGGRRDGEAVLRSLEYRRDHAVQVNGSGCAAGQHGSAAKGAVAIVVGGRVRRPR